MFLFWCAAMAAGACGQAEVSGQGGGARTDGPQGVGHGFNLPDAGPPVEDGGVAGSDRLQAGPEANVSLAFGCKIVAID
jgi:hypothetical protein